MVICEDRSTYLRRRGGVAEAAGVPAWFMASGWDGAVPLEELLPMLGELEHIAPRYLALLRVKQAEAQLEYVRRELAEEWNAADIARSGRDSIPPR